MFITKREFGDFAKFGFSLADAGKISTQKAEELVAWGNDVLDGFGDNANVELPLEFRSLFREFRKSYEQDGEAMLLELEQRANPAPYKPPTNKTYDKQIMREQLLESLEQVTAGTKSSLERLEFARRGQSESDLRGSIRLAALAGQQAASEPVRAVMHDPFQRAFWSGFAKALGGASRWLTPEERDAVGLGLVDKNGKEIFQKSLTAGTSPGSLWLSETVARAVFDICPLYGAYKTLRVIQLLQGKTKFVKVISLPSAWWTIPSQGQGQAPPVDQSLSGAAVSQECNSLLINIEASEELLQDEKVDWGVALLEKIARGLAYAVDWASFAAAGAVDSTDGGQTGIFNHGSVPTVSAAADSVPGLSHSDFLLPAAAVSPVALERGARWWVNPYFLPQLLLLKDGNLFLCQTPAQNPSGEFTLCGFPMTLTSVAPKVGTAGLPIAAFGWGDAFTIGMREDAEIMTGEPKWNQAIKSIRALTRARCDMGEPTMFAILKLAGS